MEPERAETDTAPRAGRARRRHPGRGATVALATALLVGSGVATGAYVTARSSPAATADATTSTAASTPTPESASVAPVSPVIDAAPETDRDEVLAKALVSVADSTEGTDAEFSVAVLDTATGESATYGDGSFDTASIVKVDILATVLLQAQDEGRDLTAPEKSYATVMIRNSDNAAALALWKQIGRADGLAAANKRLGLTGTEGGDGVYWGLTQTTTADQVRLLEAVFGDDSALSEESRAYIQKLMGQISDGQDWGVTAAADAGSADDSEVKNGWLPRSTTGLWDINSIGQIGSEGHTYLVAVLSRGSRTQARGVALVEDAAQAAVAAFNEIAGS